MAMELNKSRKAGFDEGSLDLNLKENSRYWGIVPAEAVTGKPLVVYFS
jgi:type IV secretory pathway protease TraF